MTRSHPEPRPHITRRAAFLIPLAAVAVLSGCSGKPSAEDRPLSDRELNIEEFLAGETAAYGQFQTVFGTVVRRFEVDIFGEWNGRTLTLTEDFVYDDGSTERRVWTLRKTGTQTWEGSAPGVVGVAEGVESGDTFNMSYRFDLPVADRKLRVRFDDWMWLVSDDRLLNRAYVSRLGVRIGEVIIAFEKP